MKKYLFNILLLVGLVIISTTDLYAQGGTCAAATQLCGGASFPAVTGGGNTGTSANSNCLFSTRNETWFWVYIDASGSISSNVSITPASDIDFAAWGPFTQPGAASCGSISTTNEVSCDYTTANGGTLTVPTAMVGEYYLILISNFGDAAGQIEMTNNSGSGSISCDPPPPPSCPGDQDFTAENICTGSPVLWSSGGNCSINGSAGNGIVVDLFIYDADGNGLPDPGGAPGGYLPTVTAPAHTAGNGPPGTDIEVQNPDITTIGFDFSCGNPPTYPFLGEPNLINETCEPVTYTFFTIVFDYDLETDNDGQCGIGVNCLEYNELCTVERYDVVVYPELVVISRGGGTCNPYAALITEDGTECAVQGNQNTDCSADINYDLTADIPAGTPAGCIPTGLTGNLTCVCCEPPDITVDPGTQIVCVDEPAFPLTVNPTGGTGTITTYTWTGGTGPLSATNIASPMFDPSFGTGSYNIVVIVDTDDGCQTSTNVIYTVLDPSACCPAQSGKF